MENTHSVLADEKSDNQNTFYAAIKKGELEKVRVAVDKGANVNAQDEDGRLPLELAAWCGHLDIVKYLVSKNADINAQGGDGRLALGSAVFFGNLEVVRFLVESGADINKGTELYNSTSLHRAAEGGHLEIIKLLLENGADIHKINNQDNSPFDLAVYGGHLEVAKYLFEKHPCSDTIINRRIGEMEEAPIHLAVRNGHPALVKWLLQKGADINSKTTLNFLPLHYSCNAIYFDINDLNAIEIMNFLVDNGTDISLFIKKGVDDSNTPPGIIFSISGNTERDEIIRKSIMRAFVRGLSKEELDEVKKHPVLENTWKICNAICNLKIKNNRTFGDFVREKNRQERVTWLNELETFSVLDLNYKESNPSGESSKSPDDSISNLIEYFLVKNKNEENPGVTASTESNIRCLIEIAGSLNLIPLKDIATHSLNESKLLIYRKEAEKCMDVMREKAARGKVGYSLLLSLPELPRSIILSYLDHTEMGSLVEGLKGSMASLDIKDDGAVGDSTLHSSDSSAGDITSSSSAKLPMVHGVLDLKGLPN